MKKILFFFLWLFLLVGATVTFVYWLLTFRAQRQSQSPNLPSPAASITITPLPTQVTLSREWKSITQGIEIKSLPYSYSAEQYDIQVVKIDPDYFDLHLAYDHVGKTISNWGQETSGIVMNAGFFKEKNQPVGLLYIDGVRKDNHRIKPSGTGLLVIGPKSIRILDLSSQDIPDEATLQNVLQSYPVLISQSQVAVKDTLNTQERRSAIGTDQQGNVYLFSAQYPHLGLYDFAKVLQESSLQLTEVLNLDGGGSTGIAINMPEYKKIIDSQTLIPTVLKVEGK